MFPIFILNKNILSFVEITEVFTSIQNQNLMNENENPITKAMNEQRMSDAQDAITYAKISKLVSEGQAKAEEKCLTEVLTGFLKRPPTDDDFKKCTKIEREGIINSYVLAYEDAKLGLITREFMCNADIVNKKTGYPDFVFNCKFNPEVTEVPLTENNIFDKKNIKSKGKVISMKKNKRNRRY